MLLLRREKSSVFLFKKFLLLSPFVCFVIPVLSKIYFPKLDLQQLPETFAALLSMIVINGVWYWYLHRSRRIRSTYGMIYDSDDGGSPREPQVYQTRVNKTGVRADLEDLSGTQSIFRRDSIMSSSGSHTELRIEKSRIDGKKVLLRTFGASKFDEVLWSRCLAKSGSDQIRACAEYWRIKAGK